MFDQTIMPAMVDLDDERRYLCRVLEVCKHRSLGHGFVHWEVRGGFVSRVSQTQSDSNQV